MVRNDFCKRCEFIRQIVFDYHPNRRLRHHRMRRTGHGTRDRTTNFGLSDGHGGEQKGHCQRKSFGFPRQQDCRVHGQSSRWRDLGGPTSFRLVYGCYFYAHIYNMCRYVSAYYDWFV